MNPAISTRETVGDSELPILVVGTRASVSFVVDENDMQRFAEISGDHNPLHTDDAFARRKGFTGKVVYGALLIAKVSQLIGMKLPGRNSVWASVALDFKKPLYVGELAEVEGCVASFSTSTGLAELDLRVHRAGKVLAKGRAEVVVAE